MVGTSTDEDSADSGARDEAGRAAILYEPSVPGLQISDRVPGGDRSTAQFAFWPSKA